MSPARPPEGANSLSEGQGQRPVGAPMSPLLEALLAEKACLEALLIALRQEDEALAAASAAELPAITQRKARLLERLAELDAGREAVQAALGFEPGRAGALAAAAGDALTREAWGTLLTLAEQARELNRRSAAKVYTHLEFAGNALAWLQSRSQPLYGPDGARRAAGRGASLARG